MALAVVVAASASAALVSCAESPGWSTTATARRELAAALTAVPTVDSGVDRLARGFVARAVAVPPAFGARTAVRAAGRPVARARLVTVFGVALDVAVTICSTTPDVENSRHR